MKRNKAEEEENYFTHQITWAEDERTTLAKADNDNKGKQAAEANHKLRTQPTVSILRRGRNLGYAVQTAFKRATKNFTKRTGVQFANKVETRQIPPDSATPMIIYDSGADGHYLSERDRKLANLPILRKSTKRVGVANGGCSKASNVTQLPFPQLSKAAAQADTFDEFPHSLMSVGKTADDGNISIFGQDGVTVHKESDVLITLKGEPLLIGVRDENGRYRIPLIQNRGQWTPRKPSKQAKKALHQANSVYDLPSTEQAIKWMHATCGFPVKSTWIKAIQAGNFTGWPLLTANNVRRYYPETVETPKGHMNQARKNVRSTKAPSPFGVTNTKSMHGKKVRDIGINVFDVKETIYSDQTGQFPTRSRSGNKYIMVMVDIDSSGILVEPMKSRKDAEMIRAYNTLMSRLHSAGIVPQKHVLDNEISTAMKALIQDQYKMKYELVPPGCHRRNAAEVAIRNFKAHFLSVLAGVADDFPPSLWDKLLPQTEITLNLLRQSNATPTISAYAHMNGPFDYNKMPLAPMGCKVQVHEKTDKRGTWAFHSVDGWYIATSPEHYRTHRCHIKATHSDRLSDTVQFQHKSITNPTVTHADKLMQAIDDCNQAIKGKSNDVVDTPLNKLQQVLQQAKEKIFSNPKMFTSTAAKEDMHAAPRVNNNAAAAVPRVANEEPPREYSDDQRVTRAMAQQQQSTTASTPSAPQAPPPIRATMKKRRRRQRTKPLETPTTAPASNTRSKTTAATAEAAPPSARTRARTHQQLLTANMPTQQMSRRRQLRSIQKKVDKLENEVYKALAVMDKETGKMMNYRQLIRHPDYKIEWNKSSANEFGRLANGVGGRIKTPTNTIEFICKAEVPKDRRKDVTYGSFVCSVRLEKKEQNRTRFVVGGNKINYPGEVATPTAEMLTAKMLFNSVISTKGAKFMTMDISNFYLMTPLKRPEFIRMKMADIPEEIIKEYGLRDKVTKDGSIFIKAKRGMYGLPQSGLLANQLLEKRLNKHGYTQSKYVPGLWKHTWRPIQFTLVVDDFGVKYVGKEHALHLQKVLNLNYKTTNDWTGNRYIGIALDWDYKRRRVHLSMPNYTKKALKQFQHEPPATPQHSPFRAATINYGAKKQYAKQESKAPLLDAKGKKFIQKVCGKFLFYGRAVDSTLLCPISAIASQSATPTTDTMEQTKQLLDYIATQDEAVLTYNASEMILAAHSDASYLSEPKARSRAGGHFFLSSNAEIPPNNGAVLNIAHIIKHVMTSATEAELAALYIMAREAVFIRIILEEMGHKQPPTPLQTDNSMADGIINGKVMPKRTKAMDMRFYWLRDRECQEQFRIYWRPGKLNYADYWTKHHQATHHQNVRREFITPHVVLEMLRMEQSRTAAPAA